MNASLVTLFLFAAFFYTACASTPPIVRLDGLPNLSTKSAGAILPVKLDTAHSTIGTDGCAFSVRRGDELKTYELPFMVGSEVFFAELPPGEYGFREVYCYGRHWDLVHKAWPRFRVYPDRLSMLDGVSIYLDDSGNMSTDLSGRARSRQETLRFLGHATAENRDRVVSAYTGRPIPPSAVEREARWKNWELKDADDRPIASKSAEWPTFRSCYRGEEDVNGLWLGNVELHADFENGKLSDFRMGDAWSTFSDHFIECVKTTLHEFKPTAKTTLRYTLFI